MSSTDPTPSSEEHRTRADRAEQLTEVLATVGAAPDLVSALEALLRGAMRLLGGHRGSADVFEPQNGTRVLKIRVEADGTLEVLRNPGPPGEQGFGRQVLSHGEPVAIHDMEAARPNNRAWAHRGMRGSLYVAIESRGQRIGTFHVDHPQAGYFASADHTLAQALASKAGAVIERARLDAAREDQARLDGALLVARTAVHEINNALAPVVGFAELLRNHPAVAGDAELQRYVRLIYDASQEAAAKVRRLQHIIRVEVDPQMSAGDYSVLAPERASQPPSA